MYLKNKFVTLLKWMNKENKYNTSEKKGWKKRYSQAATKKTTNERFIESFNDY